MPVRPATDDDVAALAVLRRAWTEEDHGGPLGDDGFDGRLASWWDAQREQRRHWLAEVDDEAVGMASVVHIEPMPMPGTLVRPWGYVHHVYVRPRLRGTGVGTELMKVVVDACRAAGYRHLLLHGRPRAVPFYERLGFVVHGSYLRLVFE